VLHFRRGLFSLTTPDNQLADARNRAVVRWKDKEFPTCEMLVDSWEPMTFVDEK